ncbi:glycoside hydrolase superfamily [Paraphoma chrysanthemicola]|uniref:Probable glucan endo-1,3-beta-glucosidase eglC n=1 Tax=Paraphoma chrysanthemicola TaxID=798071 RepID=A0A8K0RBD5_9PLEO|nr:glycoside hydrolase superfamily [Paraphoma chrysanthemicola]
MRFSSSLIAAAGLLSTANAAIKGFNYGAQFNNDQAKTLVDFEYEFNAAKNLPGTSGWTSARLYTMIQHGTQNTVIEAIQAAINTQTRLLLGMWASAGQTIFDNELTALKAAIAQYGTAFTDLVDGISVGSEDLYRITPTGIENNSGAGAQPQELINYVQQTRNAIAGTSLAGKPIGHVDTWTVYVNATNNDFISSLDFVGMDAYPYFQTTMANNVGSGSQLFFDAYHATVGAAQGKPVWVTETGWPVSGQTLNQGVPSADNARIYWEDVVCQLVADNVNLYYYILQDVQYGNPVPSFGIKPAGDLQAVNPLFDLSCPASAKPVSYFFSLALSSTLSPLLFLILYNLSIAWSLLRLVLPVVKCDCPCMNTVCWPVHSSTRAAMPHGRSARTNGQTKSSSTSSRTATLGSSSSIRVPTTRLSSLLTTSLTASVTTPTSSASTTKTLSSSLRLSDIPTPTSVPIGIRGPYESPNLVVPIDKANPTRVVGNGYTGQLSQSLSTIFVFDVRPEHKGKICNLLFFVPPAPPFPDMSPARIRTPGGITVSRLSNGATRADVSAIDVGPSTPVGVAPSIQSGGQYTVGSGPCDAGERVAYQVDSSGGLTMDFFQMTAPALGLFMIPS